MPRPIATTASERVLFVTSELFPLVKTGGLADVSAALPAALNAHGVDARVLIPGYREVLDGDVQWRTVVPGLRLVPAVWQAARLLAGDLRVPGQGTLTVYAIDCPDLYSRSGGPYQDASGLDWADNDARFALLGAVAAYLATTDTALDWKPEILHLNDWQASLAAAYLAFAPAPRPAVMTTIHNLSFAGDFPASRVVQWGLPPHAYDVNGLEYYGRASFLKAGLYYADHITTVSPTYALEIQSTPLGCGFEGLLASRADRVTGILNGIDTAAWDPSRDDALVAPFSAHDLSGKASNKQAIQRRFGLEAAARAPLLGMVTRLTWQKGVDSVLAAADGWLREGAQLAVIGSGDPGLESSLSDLARRHAGRMGFLAGYDEPAAHLLEGGADLFLMPSRFEPCGLNQMYSMRYGTVPVVRRTGGLADTVRDARHGARATGFVFSGDGDDTLHAAVERALALYKNRARWQRLQLNGMSADFSWHTAASIYRDLYGSLVQRDPEFAKAQGA
ncbi:MAG: glycogen synthase GlgA [Pseudomonadota bacterium]